MSFVYGYNVGPKSLGIDYTVKHTTPQHQIGSISYDNRGRKWIYVKSNATIAAGKLVRAVHLADPFTNVIVATASNAATRPIGISVLALSAGDYAWIVNQGVVEDDAQLVSALAAGSPFISNGTGQAVIAVETDINNVSGLCLVDDGDSTGTLLLF